jgi:hypothetical protein
MILIWFDFKSDLDQIKIKIRIRIKVMHTGSWPLELSAIRIFEETTIEIHCDKSLRIRIRKPMEKTYPR